MPLKVVEFAGDGPHLTEAELAARWRVSLRTMQRWRRKGFAPPRLTLGRFTIYRIPDVLAFEARHMRDTETK